VETQQYISPRQEPYHLLVLRFPSPEKPTDPPTLDAQQSSPVQSSPVPR
jgi:hypothetical protein